MTTEHEGPAKNQIGLWDAHRPEFWDMLYSVSGPARRGGTMPGFTVYESVWLAALRRENYPYEQIVQIFMDDQKCISRSSGSLREHIRRLNKKYGKETVASPEDLAKALLGRRAAGVWGVFGRKKPEAALPIEAAEAEIEGGLEAGGLCGGVSASSEDGMEEAVSAGVPSAAAKAYPKEFGPAAEAILKTLEEEAPGSDPSGYGRYELAYLYLAYKAGVSPEKLAGYFAADGRCRLRSAAELAAKTEECAREGWTDAQEAASAAARLIDAEGGETEDAAAVEAAPKPAALYGTGYNRNVDYGGGPKRYTPGDKKPPLDYPVAPVYTDSFRTSDKIIREQFAQKKRYLGTVQSLFSILRSQNGAGLRRAVRIPELAFVWKCSEDEAAEAVDAFIGRGVPVTRDGGLVRLIQKPEEADDMKLVDVRTPEIDLGNGVKAVRIGVVSDTHYGSPQCEEELIERFYDLAYGMGVRTFVHAGDVFDGEGVYKGHAFELKIQGFDKQISHIADIYPRYKDAETYMIAGNHDHSFIARVGANPVAHLAMMRGDIKFAGIYQANIRLNDEFCINLHHGASGGYRSAPETYLRRVIGEKQRFLQATGFDKYDLVVLGHFHVDAEVETPICRKGLYGGGWQDSTAFTKRLNIPPYLGGFVVTLYKLPDGSHKVSVDKISFSEYGVCGGAFDGRRSAAAS